MNFTAWKIWGASGSWQRNWLPVIGAAILGVILCVFTHDISFFATLVWGAITLVLYVPIALLISMGPFHKIVRESTNERNE